MQKVLEKLLQQKKISFNTQQINFMLQNIGNTNSHLRGDLIYNLFARGFDEDAFTFVQKQLITNELIESGNLFKAIKLDQNDFVFLRSFTALALAEIISADGKKNFLSDKDRKKLFSMSIVYLSSEKDFRGFVSGKGWAHTVAHGSDFLAASIRNPLFSLDMVDKSFKVFFYILNQLETAFVDNEEQRISFALISALESNKIIETEFVDYLLKLNESRWASFSFSNQRSCYQMNVWICILQNVYFMLNQKFFLTRKTINKLIQNYYKKEGYAFSD
ncbi:DUF2785 domain-containing protein [Oenococcus oeni]